MRQSVAALVILILLYGAASASAVPTLRLLEPTVPPELKAKADLRNLPLLQQGLIER